MINTLDSSKFCQVLSSFVKFLKLGKMSDGEKIPLIAYHSVNPVKYTSLEEQTNTRSYLYKLIVCNICILITILTIFLIRIGIGVLYFLDPALLIKLEALIITIIVTTYISLGGLTLVKICLTRKILTISKQFNIHTNKICTVLFIILIIIDLSLYIYHVMQYHLILQS